MKKAIIFIVFLILYLNVISQIKDSLKIDTTYAVIFKKTEFDWLINLIKTQDEKPSIINQQLQAIYQKTQLVLPNKEKPKK